MQYRDSSQNSMHLLNGIAAGVDSSNGVSLYGTSTGGVVEPISDDANTSLIVRGKGTGAVVLGNSSSPVNLGAGVGNLKGIDVFTVQFTPPALSSGFGAGTSAQESTYTVTGVSTGTVLSFTPTNPINALYNVRARCSTLNELVLCFSHNGISTLGSGESTNRGRLIQFRF